MKCPQCQFTVSNKKDVCGRCFLDLRPKKAELGLPIFNPRTPIETLIEQEKKEAQPTANAPKSFRSSTESPSQPPEKPKSSMPPWLLRLFFTKTSRPVTPEQIVAPQVAPASAAQSLSPSRPAPAAQPSRGSRPADVGVKQMPVVDEGDLFSGSQLRSVDFAEDVRKVLRDTFADDDDSPLPTKSGGVSIEQLMQELEEITSMSAVATDAGASLGTSTAMANQPARDLGIEALIAELDQATSAEDESNEELNRLFELALSLETKVGEAKESTAALAVHPFSEEVSQFDSARPHESPAAEIAADMFVDLETVESNDASALEPLADNDIWSSGVRETIPEPQHSAPQLPSAPAAAPVTEAPIAELPSSPTHPLLEELLILLSEAYGVDPNILLGIEAAVPQHTEPSKPSPAPLDPLTQLTAELDHELLLLQTEGTTFMTTEGLEHQEATIAEDSAVQSTVEAEIEAEAEPIPNPLHQLESELDQELAALSHEGTSFARADQVTGEISTEEPAIEHSPEMHVSAVENEIAYEDAEESPVAEDSVEAVDGPVHDFSEELAILAREAELFAASQRAAHEVQEEDGEQYEEEHEVEVTEVTVISEADLHTNGLDEQQDEMTASSPVMEEPKSVRNAHVEETQVIDNSELMRIVAEIEQQYDSQTKQPAKKAQMTAEQVVAAGMDPTAAENNLIFQPASPGARIRAAVVDFIVSLTLGMLVSLLFISDVTRSELLSFSLPQLHVIAPDLVVVIASIFVAWVVTSWIFSAQGMQTFGSKMCKFMVVDTDGFPLTFSHALLRALCQITTLLTGGIGFLPVWRKTRRTLHDFLSKSQVIVEFQTEEPDADVIRQKVYNISSR